MINNLLFEY